MKLKKILSHIFIISVALIGFLGLISSPVKSNFTVPSDASVHVQPYWYRYRLYYDTVMTGVSLCIVLSLVTTSKLTDKAMQSNNFLLQGSDLIQYTGPCLSRAE